MLEAITAESGCRRLPAEIPAAINSKKDSNTSMSKCSSSRQRYLLATSIASRQDQAGFCRALIRRIPFIMLFCLIFPAQSQSADKLAQKDKTSIDSKYKKSCINSDCHPRSDDSASPLHVPYLEEQCLACHVDHAQKTEHQLKEGGNKLCLACHTKTETGSSAHVLHPPRVSGEEEACTDCHSPHGSRIRNLLRDEKQLESCSECHSQFLESGQKYPYTHGFFNPQAQCGFCHYAHQKSGNAFLRENVKESCLTCHDLAIRTKTRRLENIGEKLRTSKVIHGATAESSCAACHTPHGSIQEALLKEGYPAGSYAKYDSKQYALCWQCHSSKLAESMTGVGATNFRNKTTNLHRLHLAQLGRGRACHLCHAAHASDQLHLLKKEVTFKFWKAAFKYRALPNGGTCATACHREKPYRRN